MKKFMIGFCSPMGFMAWQVGNNRCMLGWTGLNQRLYPLLDLEWPSNGLVLKSTPMFKQEVVGVLAVQVWLRVLGRSDLVWFYTNVLFWWGKKGELDHWCLVWGKSSLKTQKLWVSLRSFKNWKFLFKNIYESTCE